MADRGGLFIRIGGGVERATIDSMRVFARSLAELSGVARGLEKVDPGRGLDRAAKKVKGFKSSIVGSMKGIISMVERYKQSASDIQSITAKNVTRVGPRGQRRTGADLASGVSMQEAGRAERQARFGPQQIGTQFNERMSAAKKQSQELAAQMGRTTESVQRYMKQTEQAAASTNTAGRRLEGYKQSASGASEALRKISQGTVISKSAINGLANASDRMKRFQRETKEALTAINRFRPASRALREVYAPMSRSINQTYDAQQRFTEGVAQVAAQTKKAGDSTRTFTQKASDASAALLQQTGYSEEYAHQMTAVARNTEKAGERLSLFQRITQGLSNAFERINARIKQFAAFVLAAMVVQQVTQAMRQAVQAISQFDQALQNLQAIIDISASQAKILGEVIREVSRNTKFSIQEVSEGMRNLGQAGLSMQESMAAIEGVARLATGTMSNFETVADLTTTTINAFNLAATEAARIADVFANAINNSKLSVDKLSTAFNYVGAAGNQAGLTLNEVSGTLMTLADNGLRASTMGTGLRRMMLKMIDASSELSADLNALGISVDNINPKLAGWQGSLENLVPLLWDARRETVDMGKAAEYFGTRAAQVAAVLVRNAADGSDALGKAIMQTEKFGSAADMAETQIEGLSLSFKNLTDRLGNLAVAIGEAGLLDAMHIFVDVSAQLVTGLEKLISKYSSFIKAIAVVAPLSTVGYLIGRTATRLSGLIGSLHASITAVGGLRMRLKSLVGQIGAVRVATVGVSTAVAATVYAIYRFSNAAAESAKEASKAAQEYNTLAQGIQEWGKSLEDAFGTGEWENTVERFEDVEIAGRNLSRMLEEELGYSLEQVPSRGIEGFEELQKAVNDVSTDMLDKQLDKTVEQLDAAFNSARRMSLFAGQELPEAFRKSTEQMSLFELGTKRIVDGIRGVTNAIKYIDPASYLMNAFGPDQQENVELLEDAIYNLTQRMDTLAEVEDWGIKDAAENAQKAVEDIRNELKNNAQPAVDKFINDMTAEWGGRAARELRILQNEFLMLQKKLNEGSISLEEFKESAQKLELPPVISEKRIQNINSVEEAMVVAGAAAEKYGEQQKELENQIEQLFRGEKNLAEVLNFVTEDMDLQEKTAKRLANMIHNLSQQVNSSIQSYDIFLERLERLGPEAKKAYEELTDAQKAHIRADFSEEIAGAGEELQKQYEELLGRNFKELTKKHAEELEADIGEQEVSRRLADFDANTVWEAFQLIYEERRKAFKEMLDGFEEESDSEEDIWENWAQQIKNAQQQALMHIEDGSVEALRIQEKYVQSELELARKRWAEDPTVENFGKLLDAKENFLDKSKEKEEKITENVVNESEKRMDQISREFDRREARLERAVVTGRVGEADEGVRQAELEINRIKEKINEQKNFISELENTKAKDEDIREARNKLKNLERELYEAETNRLENYIDRADAVFKRDKSLAEQRKKLALAGIEEEKERIELKETDREGVLAVLEKETQLNYENTQKKLAAEKEYRNQVLSAYEDKLNELERLGQKETDNYKEVQTEKVIYAQKSAQKIKQLEEEKVRAQIRAEGSFFERMKLGFRNAQGDMESWGDFTVDMAEDVFTKFSNGAAKAFTDFVTGTESAKEAFRSFAHNFFNMIAQMIAKQMAFNAVSAAMGAFGGGYAKAGGSTAMALQNVSTAHEGGIVGKDVGTKLDGIVTNMQRFHNGLNPDEYHAVLQKGERVVSKPDVSEEKEKLNSIESRLEKQEQKQESKEQDKGTRIVNVLDPSIVDEWASSSRGEKIIMNTVTRNRNQLRRVL